MDAVGLALEVILHAAGDLAGAPEWLSFLKIETLGPKNDHIPIWIKVTCALTMAAGGVLSYLLLIPMIKFFGEKIAGPLAPGTIPIADMSPHQVRGAYVLYIGAGAVVTKDIIKPGIYAGNPARYQRRLDPTRPSP